MPWRPGSAGGKVWDTVLDLPGSGSEVPAGALIAAPGPLTRSATQRLTDSLP
jgi:hypothetical protein